jgi:rSAM-associated Gly-rich repeat protein
MNIKTQMGWASFLVALSAFNLPVDAAIAPQTSPTTQTQASIESRLTQISATLKAKASQLPDNASETHGNGNLALGWANRSGGGGGGFVNANRGGGWRNGNNWRNGWSDGGSFFNRR